MTFPHWSYFETIDEDLYAFSRQVEFDKANFATYSVQLTRLYLSICSEAEIVAKELCNKYSVALPQKPNIEDLRKVLMTKFPNITKLSITIRPLQLDVLPLADWDSGTSPRWWVNYNKLLGWRRLSALAVSFSYF
jgi:hypothetical protein